MQTEQPENRPRRAVSDEDTFAGLYRGPQPKYVYLGGDQELVTGYRESTRRARPHHAELEETAYTDVFADDESAASETGGFGKSILFTLLSAVLPGLGLVGSKRRGTRMIGVTLALGCVGALAIAAVFFLIEVNPEPGQSWPSAAVSTALTIAVNRNALSVAMVVILGLGMLWVALIAGTNLATRPSQLGRGKRAVAAVLVAVLSLGVGAPLAVGVNYARVFAATLNNAFGSGGSVNSKTVPQLDDGENPFKGMGRLNILLLGADSDEARIQEHGRKAFGIRTDTIILASIDTDTGRTSLIQIPRNVQYTPFPEGSEMDRQFPSGFRGPGESGDWYVNMIWERVTSDYPKLFAGQTYRGAEALKQGIEGITGLKPHYFLMLNIDGLSKLIDAMGGVTVNVNQRLPIGGSTKNRKATGGWLMPGPNQHFDGYHAMWYGRSRWSTDDYDRMARQSCLIKAMISQANPTTVLTRFEAIANASTDMMRTDIPQEAISGLVQLGLKAKELPMERLTFLHGKNYNSVRPDFEDMRQQVEDFLAPKQQPSPSPSAAAPSTSAPAATEAGSTPAAPATTKAPETPKQSDGGSSGKKTPQPKEKDQPDEDSPQDDASAPPNSGVQELGDACAYHPQE